MLSAPDGYQPRGLVIVFERRMKVAESQVPPTEHTEADEINAEKARRAAIAKAARREREGAPSPDDEGTVEP